MGQIADLRKADGIDRLRHRLEDVPETQFSPVAPSRQKLQPKAIAPYTVAQGVSHVQEKANSPADNLIADNSAILNADLKNLYRFQAVFTLGDTALDTESLVDELEKTVGEHVMSYLPALYPAFRKSATHREFAYQTDLSKPNVSGYQEVHALSIKSGCLTLEMVTKSNSVIGKNLHYELANCLVVIGTLKRMVSSKSLKGMLSIKLQTNSAVTFTPEGSYIAQPGLLGSYVFDDEEDVFSVPVLEYDFDLFKAMVRRLAKLFHLTSPNSIFSLPPLLKVNDAILDEFVGRNKELLNF
jgi:hypothetical protein